MECECKAAATCYVLLYGLPPYRESEAGSQQFIYTKERLH